MFGTAPIYYQILTQTRYEYNYLYLNPDEFFLYIKSMIYNQRNKINNDDSLQLNYLLSLLQSCAIGGKQNINRLKSKITYLKNSEKFGRVSFLGVLFSPDMRSTSRDILLIIEKWLKRNKRLLNDRDFIVVCNSSITDSLL